MSNQKVLGLHPGCVYTDHLQVHPDECVEFVAHHLRLAAMFYQSTPEGMSKVNAEILRLITQRSGGHGPETLAASHFIDCLRNYYENLRKEDL